MFLQIDVTTPEPIPADSVQQILHQTVEYMKTDPDSFFHDLMDSAINFGLKVLAAILIYIVGSWLIGRVKKLMQKSFEKRQTERTLATFISSFVSITLTILLVVITVGTLGVDTTSLAALLAAGGVAIGMALSGTVQNFAGGLMILVFKPFKAGDFIQAQGVMGTVMEVNITATKILTVDNRVVILPNGALSNGTIDNYSGRPLRRVDWKVSVEYGSDAAACKQAILAILNSDQRILNAKTDVDALYAEFSEQTYHLDALTKYKAIPDPFVALTSLNESDISFVVRAWVIGADYWDVYFAMNERFYTELPKQGFGFAYPHIHVVK